MHRTRCSGSCDRQRSPRCRRDAANASPKAWGQIARGTGSLRGRYMWDRSGTRLGSIRAWLSSWWMRVRNDGVADIRTRWTGTGHHRARLFCNDQVNCGSRDSALGLRSFNVGLNRPGRTAGGTARVQRQFPLRARGTRMEYVPSLDSTRASQ